jgi:hypothetical protein
MLLTAAIVFGAASMAICLPHRHRNSSAASSRHLQSHKANRRIIDGDHTSEHQRKMRPRLRGARQDSAPPDAHRAHPTPRRLGMRQQKGRSDARYTTTSTLLDPIVISLHPLTDSTCCLNSIVLKFTTSSGPISPKKSVTPWCWGFRLKGRLHHALTKYAKMYLKTPYAIIITL